MKPIPETRVCVVDHGQFPFISERLARDCKQVAYWSPWEETMPSMRNAFVGELGKAERINDFWSGVRDFDVYVFPDVGFVGEQKQLRELGLPVWGAGAGAQLETSRGLFLSTLKQLGLPVPPHRVIQGFDDLREYLRDKEDLYVKVSRWRGDWETLHWRSWAEDEFELVGRELKLGRLKKLVTFYVFEPIKTELEDGIDPWCIDGQFPQLVYRGLEAKDKFFLGTFQEWSELASGIRETYEKFAPVLASFGYRAGFSSEFRVAKDGTYNFIDPTCRFGSPPSQLQTELIANFSEVVCGGAQGECVEPEPQAEFGVQGLVEFGESDDEWASVVVPDKLERWLKCSYAWHDGEALVFPPIKNAFRAWLVGIGDTIEEAADHLKENAALLPDGLHCRTEALADLLAAAEAAEEQGNPITDQPIPEPAAVLAESK